MRLRIILSLVLVVLVAIGGVVVFIYLDTPRQVQAYMVQGNMVGSETLAGVLENYYAANGSWDGVESILTNQSGRGMGGRRMGMMSQRFVLTDSAGQVVIDTSGQFSAGTNLTVDSLSQALRLTGGRGELQGYLLAQSGMAGELSAERPLVQRLNSAALRAGLLATGIALLLAGLLAARLLKPVQQLTKAVERMAAGDLKTQVPVQGNDELAVLARSFNSMTASLRDSEARRQAMTADIAHELRTPLAVQRAQLEALQDGIYPMTAENLQPVLDQTELLVRLVEDLRTLALADAGELRLEKTAVNLPEVLGGIVERFRPAADAHRVTLSLEQEETETCPEVQADPDRLAQIFHNLLSNALRFTPEGGQVKVRLHCDIRWMVVQVEDSGPGIPPESLPRLFERFYRGDRSRSRDEGGTGLGLAIARQLAIAHGGSLEAENLAQGGARFTLQLPAA